jgi:hypothetical protein
MDEKGARIECPPGEEVIVPTYIKEMYTGIPENRKSLIVIESVSADGRAIPPELLYTIRDPEKQRLPDELEALTIHPDLDQALLVKLIL